MNSSHLFQEYSDFTNDTKHNHGFSLRPNIKDPADPRWGFEWTAKIFCTVKMTFLKGRILNEKKFFMKIFLLKWSGFLSL